MDEEFARAAYDAHQSLLRHYSAQIFKTRISIITLIVIACGYLVGLIPPQRQPVDLAPSAGLAYLSALLVGLLFSLEIAYYRRFLQVVKAGRIIEDSQGAKLYFNLWDHGSPWRLYSIYIVGIVCFIAIALIRFHASTLWNPYRLLASVVVVPLALAGRTLLEFSRTAKMGLELNTTADEESRRSPNPADRVDR